MTITLPCPSCGKETAAGVANCTRCGTELSVLFQIKQQSETERKQASLDLRKNRPSDCLRNCECSWSNLPSIKTAELAIIAAVLTGDSFLVMRWKWRIDKIMD